MEKQRTPLATVIEKIVQYKLSHFENNWQEENREKQIVVDTILELILKDIDKEIPNEREELEKAFQKGGDFAVNCSLIEKDIIDASIYNFDQTFTQS
jgi:GTPase Era involved in 16S rRNA processing